MDNIHARPRDKSSIWPAVLALCAPMRGLAALCAALGFGQLAEDARARGSRKSWVSVLAALCAVGAAACSMGMLTGVTVFPALYGFSAVGLIFCGAAAVLRQREQPRTERGLLGVYLALCGAEILLCGLCLYWARSGLVHVETGVLEHYQVWNRRALLLELARCAAGAGLVLRGSRAKQQNRPRRTSAGGVPLPKIISPAPFSAGRSGEDRFPRHSRARPG